MARDGNTYAKRQRETQKRQKQDAKRERRQKRKDQPETLGTSIVTFGPDGLPLSVEELPAEGEPGSTP